MGAQGGPGRKSPKQLGRLSRFGDGQSRSPSCPQAVAELSLGYCGSGECSVVYHNFAKNRFGGRLTSLLLGADRYGNRTLHALILDHNNFTGSLAAILLEHCSNLNGLIVSFRDNKISGELTEEICSKCHAIRVLVLAENQISGVLPANIGLLDALVKMDISKTFCAAGSFNASNCIGSGGFGATYKAEIAPGILVAIKRLAIGRFQDDLLSKLLRILFDHNNPGYS
ncbi:hypothetical protein ZWY2020_025808 [Hordeum vulgare]|nr:hypothetical protein ZWY2020_025808 [Hordeum vulgare]